MVPGSRIGYGAMIWSTRSIEFAVLELEYSSTSLVQSMHILCIPCLPAQFHTPVQYMHCVLRVQYFIWEKKDEGENTTADLMIHVKHIVIARYSNCEDLHRLKLLKHSAYITTRHRGHEKKLGGSQ